MPHSKKFFVGLDIGSISVNLVVITSNGSIVEDHYLRHKGQPLNTACESLKELLVRIPSESIQGIAVTGSGGKLIADLLGASFENEIIAQSKAVARLYPHVRTLIEMGGEDSKLIILKKEKESTETTIEDFAMNDLCAAGTGSFLDQQASRLGVTIEDFGSICLKSKNPPRIAGRCSVFAKTDMIHLQQMATPDYDIIAGLCYAVVRNFCSNVAKGKKFIRPVAFQGGVAANVGMIRAFKDILELEDKDFIIPEYFTSMGAIGAVLILMEKSYSTSNFKGISELEEYITKQRVYNEVGLEPLAYKTLDEIRNPNLDPSPPIFKDKTGKVNVYLGIDVGSISTNVVALDEDKRVIARRYLMTAGRPIEAVRRGLEEIGEEIGKIAIIKGAGTTGSGRYLIADFVGADIVRNEITAQARAAAEINPDVDTIFEIGGQDSKFISLENGVVVDFEMNKVCAAGTGSFLEEQSEKLNINIKQEFGDRALESKCPVRLGERCTVFMESDLVHHQQAGSERDDLVGGLCYSIVYNYLNRVVGDKRVGDNIFFQGGVAANKGVVAAFEKVTGKKITVPDHHDVTGAIGMALIAMEEENWEKSEFKGFELSKRKYELFSFVCGDCPNVCEINRVTVEGETPLYYGSRCEKYEVRKKKKGEEIIDLFGEREKLLLSSYLKEEISEKTGKVLRVGIPRTLHFYELYPFWNTFFRALGCECVLSDKSNKKIIHDGVENVATEICFPVKLAHGHILNLLEKEIDFLFMPSIINLFKTNNEIDQNYYCPYIQALPYIIKAAIELKKREIRVLKPIVHFQNGVDRVKKELLDTGAILGKSPKEISKAVDLAIKAQKEFYKALQNRGKEFLSSLKDDERAIVFIGRPYNTCDHGLNLELPKKLRELGITPVPMDMLPLSDAHLIPEWCNMYWRSGQKILSAVDILKNDERLYALYLSNFSCGPDSFLISFFRKMMGNKPYLQIEIDEHSADVGAITRCEAYLDSMRNVERRKKTYSVAGKEEADAKKLTVISTRRDKRKLYIPNMADHAYALRAAFVSCGVDAEVLPNSDAETLIHGRKYTSGKQCYPCIITTGDIVKKVMEPGFDPASSAFFMATANGPCRFGQYVKLQRMVLDELGYHNVPIVYSDSRSSYRDFDGLGKEFRRRAWQGIVATDLLLRMCWMVRPYEIIKGETDKLYNKYLDEISSSIMNKNDLLQTIREAKELFANIKTDRSQEKPIIGIVGEIFLRWNRFSNEEVIRRVEDLGGEARVAPMAEWIFYTNYCQKNDSLEMGRYIKFLTGWIEDKIQWHDEHKFAHILEDFLKDVNEPPVEEILENSRIYLDSSFGGEAILSVGKAIDYIRKGFSGIINTMPFTCMPGTVVTAVSKKLREEWGNIPWLNIAYDGLKQTNVQIRLEAFLYQAKQYMTQRR